MILPPFTDAKLKILAKGLRAEHRATLALFVERPEGLLAPTLETPASRLAAMATLGLCQRADVAGDRIDSRRWRLNPLGEALRDYCAGVRA